MLHNNNYYFYINKAYIIPHNMESPIPSVNFIISRRMIRTEDEVSGGGLFWET
jgi:hypothetical protein